MLLEEPVSRSNRTQMQRERNFWQEKINKTTPVGMDPSAFGGASVKIKSNADAAREKFLAKKLLKKKKKKKNQATEKQQQQQQQVQLLAEKRKLLEKRQQRFAKKKKASPVATSIFFQKDFHKIPSFLSLSSVKYITCETVEMIVPKGKSLVWLPSTLRCWGQCEGMCPISEKKSTANQSREHE